MENRAPFLGTARHKFTGTADMHLRVRAPAGGEGKVQWRLAEQADFSDEQIVKFEFPVGDEWHDVTIPIAAKDSVVQLRLFLPPGKGAVEIAKLGVSAK